MHAFTFLGIILMAWWDQALCNNNIEVCKPVSVQTCINVSQTDCICQILTCVNNKTAGYIENCDPFRAETLLGLFSEKAINYVLIKNTKLSTFPTLICSKMKNLLYIHLENTFLNSIPNDCFLEFQNLDYLLLPSNNISRLDEINLPPNLQVLNVSHNHIVSISREFWKTTTMVSILDVSSNYLEEENFYALYANDPMKPGFTELHLYNNSFDCDCGDIWIKSWIKNNLNYISHPHKIKCKNSATNVPKEILKLEDNDYVCEIVDKNTHLIIALTATFITILIGFPVLITVVCFLLYMKRYNVYGITNWHPFDRDECQGEGKLFDIYISLAPQNEEWVNTSLLPFLKLEKYKVTSYREQLAQLTNLNRFNSEKKISDCLSECIRHSKRTICVMSPEYFTNEICTLEMKSALNYDLQNKKKRTIFITDRNNARANILETFDLNVDITNQIKKCPYFNKNSGKFKTNLLYCLPLRKLNEDEQANTTISDQINFDNFQRIEVSEDVPMYDYF